MKIHYCEEDKALNEREFIRFANQVWPGDYDEEKTKAAQPPQKGFVSA